MAFNLSKEICERFLNTTTKYDLKGEYSSLTDVLSSDSRIAPIIQTKNVLKQLSEKVKDQSIPERFTSAAAMKEEAKKFFQGLGETWYPVAKMLENPETSINIKLKQVGYNTSYTTMDSDYKNDNYLEVTPDVLGLMTICQVMANSYVLSKVREDQKELDAQHEYLIERTVNMFIGYQITKYIQDHYPELTTVEVDQLHNQLFKELYYDIGTLETDRALYSTIINEMPERFDTINNPNNLTPDNFASTMRDLTAHLDSNKQSMIEDRVETIAQTGCTTRYIQNGVALQISLLKNKSKNFTVNQLITTATNTFTRTNVLGENEKDVINENPNAVYDPSEKTTAILTDETMPNVVDETIHEQGRLAENEEENVLVKQLERQIKPNNY